MSSFLKDMGELSEAKGEHVDDPHSLRAPLQASRWVPNLKPAPPVEAPGQAEASFTEGLGVCFRLLSGQCLGVVACQKLSLQLL